MAETLAAEGHHVCSLPELRRAGRQPDLEVCGIGVEIKSFDPLALRSGRPPSPRAVCNKLLDASGQAMSVVLSGYGSGLTEETVRRGLARLTYLRPDAKLRRVRAMGDGFDISWERAPVRVVASSGAATLAGARPRDRFRSSGLGL